MAVENVLCITPTRQAVRDSLQQELLDGLMAPRKSINPKFFYDAKGSALFNRICDLPEYYPTRTEIRILKRHATDIAELTGQGSVLIEPGAGSCEKVRYLLPELNLKAYLPLDISREFLQQAASELAGQFPALQIKPMAVDFSDDFELSDTVGDGRRVLFYPGSTIGNFTPEQALQFLQRMRRLVGAGGGLIIGVDLHKDRETLEAAYNDSQGVTAAFNLNILHHVNRLLGGDFNPQHFRHYAFYNNDKNRIEMHLISDVEHSVSLNGESIQLAAGEGILTEYSYKYTIEGFTRLANKAGFSLKQNWQDDKNRFGVFFFLAD